MAKSKEERAAYQKAYKEANKEKIQAYRRAYKEANREVTAAKRRVSDKAYYEANKEKIRVREKAYYEANKEKILARDKAYREANKEEVLAREKAYREANKEQLAANYKAYYEANKEQFIAKSARQRALKRKQVPIHLRDCPHEKQRLVQIYKLRNIISEATGVRHHVDHMWPLADGGPHWSGNLQIIPAEENISKHASVCEETKTTIIKSLYTFESERSI